MALLRTVIGNLKRNKLYPPHSKQNENKTHINPHISLVLSGNFQFFKSACLRTLLLASIRINASSSECNFKFIFQTRNSMWYSHISEILESVAPRCPFFISVPCETGHNVNGGFQISNLQITA